MRRKNGYNYFQALNIEILIYPLSLFRKGLPNETQCYSLVNLTPSGLFRILHIE